MRKSMLLIGLAMLFSCYQNPYYDASKKHHNKKGFQNIPPSPIKSWKDFRRWQKERKQAGTKKPTFPKTSPFEIKAPDPIIFTEHQKDTVTWLGHATVLIQTQGKTILTDPHFSSRASPVSFAGPKRYTQNVLRIDQLPEIDYVFISHDHYDHLDKKTILALNKKKQSRTLTFFVPLGYKDWFNKLAIKNVVEMDWWDQVNANGLTITCTPVQHWTRRSMRDLKRRLWSGWAIKSKTLNFFFTGDSGYTHFFKEIGSRLGPFDLSAIPIGAYAPRWFMKDSHMDVSEAIQTHQDLRSKLSLGIHWGTFILTDEPLLEPKTMLNNTLQNPENSGLAPFLTFSHGQTKILQ